MRCDITYLGPRRTTWRHPRRGYSDRRSGLRGHTSKPSGVRIAEVPGTHDSPHSNDQPRRTASSSASADPWADDRNEALNDYSELVSLQHKAAG